MPDVDGEALTEVVRDSVASGTVNDAACGVHELTAGPKGNASPIIYTMRAYKASELQHVYWTAMNSPDLTGALSGHASDSLLDIVIFHTKH